jgi:hypothetical protein
VNRGRNWHERSGRDARPETIVTDMPVLCAETRTGATSCRGKGKHPITPDCFLDAVFPIRPRVAEVTETKGHARPGPRTRLEGGGVLAAAKGRTVVLAPV